MPKRTGVIIISDNIVAADAVGAKYLGKDPASIEHIKLAQKTGLGNADLNDIEILK